MTRDKAIKEINKILCQLEKDSGQIVQDLAINRLDVTGMNDRQGKVLATVEILLRRLPGQNWSI